MIELYRRSFWLSILYVVVRVCVNPKLLIDPSPLCFPYGNHTFVFKIYEFVSVL